ncbi:MAG: hypothetical protein ACI33N_04080, partial [Desulfovibrionaceae bacterium]
MNTSSSPVLAALHSRRLVHRCTGWLVMITLAVALGLLVDGLMAEMRIGPDRVDVVAGESMLLSGNIPLKNAVESDFTVLKHAPDSPVELTLEGYFSSHWFGSGMWRARLAVPAETAPGQYPLVVAFKDATPQSARRLLIVVWASAEDMRRHAFSWTWRTLGLRPFPLAAGVGAVGLLLVALNFWLGWSYGRLLASRGMSEVFMLAPLGRGRVEAVCGLPAGMTVEVGQTVDIYRRDGTWRCQGCVSKVEGGRVRCFMDEDASVRVG